MRWLHKKQPAPMPPPPLASLLSHDNAWRLFSNANELLTYAQLENEREHWSDWTMIEFGLERLRDHFEVHMQELK